MAKMKDVTVHWTIIQELTVPAECPTGSYMEMMRWLHQRNIPLWTQERDKHTDGCEIVDVQETEEVTPYPHSYHEPHYHSPRQEADTDPEAWAHYYEEQDDLREDAK